jgi:transcription elongation factor Elf1
METDSGSDHTLIVPPKTEVVWMADRKGQSVVVFGRCPYCASLTSVECRLDGLLHPVLQCAGTGNTFSVIFEMPKRGTPGMQPLLEFRHPLVALPEVEVAASSLNALLGYVIRAQCPYCDKPAQVLNEKGGELTPIIKCESTGKAFSVYFPELRRDLNNAGRTLTGHA